MTTAPHGTPGLTPGVSPFSSATVACRCGHRYPVQVAGDLHVSARPEVRAAVMAGTLHSVRCPLCGVVTVLEHALAYTDFPRRHWFIVVPRADVGRRRQWLDIAHKGFSDTMLERAMPIVRDEWAPEMIRRVIFGMASLREKLFIFDAGMDDHVIEILKREFIETSGLGFSPDEYFHLVDLDDETLIFERSAPGGGTTTLPLPRAMYTRLAMEGNELRARFPGIFSDIAVDYRIAYIDNTP